jgi:hypothetical protein
MIKTDMDENHEMWKDPADHIAQGIADLVPCDQMHKRINAYLHDPPLNLEKGEYCYIKIVRNHLEIGRAKIVLEE